MHVLIINGPNLNLLGTREPEIYGAMTLADIEERCRDHAQTYSMEITFHQSNHEGEIVDWIQKARTDYDAVIINAGAFTHTSVAIHDALKALDKPIIEVHLSNIYQRESFRHHSYISSLAKGVLCGFGAYGYIMAISALAHQ